MLVFLGLSIFRASDPIVYVHPLATETHPALAGLRRRSLGHDAIVDQPARDVGIINQLGFPEP